jgi:parallel beta-helix repeat protein
MRRAMLIGWLVACVPAPVAADDLCGTTITDDVKLEHDLVCSGDGLIVGADGIEIDLNGHTIAGSGTAVGIIVAGRTDVEIAGGTITNFGVAVRINSSTDIEIERVAFVGNPEGMDMQAGSVGNTIRANLFRDSTIRGIMLRGGANDNDIKFNAFSGSRLGIQVFAGANNTISNNVITGSTVAGIRVAVLAAGNTIKDNLIVSSHAPDGQLFPSAALEFIAPGSTGNVFLRNWLLRNDCALKGPTAGNAFVNNVLKWNAADTCP